MAAEYTMEGYEMVLSNDAGSFFDERVGGDGEKTPHGLVRPQITRQRYES